MGNLLDCAVNPLNPVPESAPSDGPGKPAPLDVRPLRSSLLWPLQRAYYDSEGLSAWVKNVVPSFVTSNGYMGRAYARLALGLIKDAFDLNRGGGRNPSVDYTQPVTILELGAGHAKLAYMVTENLCRYAALFPATDVRNGHPFRYIVTDAAAENVAAWREHPNLKQYFDMGVLDVAVFDAERDTEIKCQLSGDVISAATNYNPMLVIASYVFDTLPCDAFRVTGGVLEQVNLTLETGVPADAEAPTNPDILKRAMPTWSYTTLGKAATGGPDGAPISVYGEPLLDSMLVAYAEAAPLRDAASIMMPLGSIVAMRSLLKLSRGRMVLLAADKGLTRLSEMKGHREPQYTKHGSVSFMVNFHAIRQLTKAFGGYAMHTPNAEGFKVASFVFGDASVPPAEPLPPGTQPAPVHATFPLPADTASASAAAPGESALGFVSDDADVDSVAHLSHRPFPQLRWAFTDNILGFTPEDFSTLQRCIHEEIASENLSLKHALAVLRLSNYDAHVFFKFRDTIVVKSAQPSAGDSVQHDVRNDVERIYASYYPLEEGKDVCFELGRLLMGLRDYATAIDFFSHSVEVCGQHHVTYHNMGLCYYYMDELERALACFKRSLHMKPDYGEARLWWEKTATRAGLNVDDGAGLDADGASLGPFSDDEADGAAAAASAEAAASAAAPPAAGARA